MYQLLAFQSTEYFHEEFVTIQNLGQIAILYVAAGVNRNADIFKPSASSAFADKVSLAQMHLQILP